MRDVPCFRMGGEEEGPVRCTKFEVNPTNLKRVILPSASSASSGDLTPDVRPDVTTKLASGTKHGLYFDFPTPRVLMVVLLCEAPLLQPRTIGLPLGFEA